MSLNSKGGGHAMADYPVTFEVTRPAKFERPQVFIRIVAYFLLGLVMSLAYWGLPIIAAIWSSQKGSQRFLEEDGPKITGWLRWITALTAYTYMLTDRFPSEEDPSVRYEVQPSGSPNVGSALLRLIFSLPSLIVLSVLLWVSSIIWLISAVMVLIQETYPEGLYDFQCSVVRWQARLLAYHASLLGEYPPFAIDMGPQSASPPAAAAP
jgi:Domain of unknown function (DUF4389)